MSDVLDRARSSARGRPTSTKGAATEVEVVAPLWARGAFAAAWSTAVGLAVLLVVSLIVWAADSQSTASAGGAMRFAAVLWVAAHRTPLQVPDGTIAIAPLGLTVLLALLLARATAIVARTTGCEDLGSVAAVVASVTAPYAVIAAILATVAQSGGLRPITGAAFVTGAMFAAVAATAGALRGSGLTHAAWDRLPLELKSGLRVAGRAGGVLLAGATVVTIVTLLAHTGAMSKTLNGYGSGPGKFAVVVISLLLVPNAVLFGASYLTGAGFAAGSGASVTVAGSHAGAVPALPVFAAVPHARAPWPVLAVAIMIMLASGVIAGWPSAVNRPTVREQLRTIAIAAAILLVGAAIVGALAGGPAGPGRLAAVGPSPWQFAVAATVEISVVGLIVIAGHAWIDQARAMLRGRS